MAEGGGSVVVTWGWSSWLDLMQRTNRGLEDSSVWMRLDSCCVKRFDTVMLAARRAVAPSSRVWNSSTI